ncbi:vascular endothelial growth factor receptor 2-like [Lingula anatina]|uniref:Vascular endothelial growth factor receptor 2-like n=1 Tax=Lingula anatina TaxID=7574 RepID=A0A1S3KGR5_LINAN|nr:vascular endothelial growth factor receptor 2-like [Lingula anatina]|eukprot:XP_013421649.1 vascular endothelial growth factor receptor 2-like [Lingula anatina]
MVLKSNSSAVGEEGCDFDQPVFVSPHCRERYCAWKYDAVVGENVTLVCTVNYTADSGSSLYLSYASCRQPCSPLRQDCPSNKTLPCRISHVIRAVKEIDEDRWTCSVHHPQCLNHNSIELKLNVRPQKTIKLDKSPVNHTVRVGETVSFDSYAEGYPEPTPEWWHDGLFMASSPHIDMDDNGTITIYNVSKDDAGVYRVTWEGKYGKVASSANLVVEDEPSPAGHQFQWWWLAVGGVGAIALLVVTIVGFIRAVFTPHVDERNFA